MGFDLVWGSREGLRLDRRKAMAFNAQRVSKISALHLIEREKERLVLFSSLALVTCVALKLNFEPFVVSFVTILSGFECAHQMKSR